VQWRQGAEIIRIGIIACATFEEEIDHLLQDDPDIFYKEYLEFGLHERPEELKKNIIEKVNSLEGRVDAVFLGYGICNSLEGIVKSLSVPTVTMEADDCVGVLLTTEEYAKERKKCAGTLYHTPYFADFGVEWWDKKLNEQMPNHKDLGVDTKWFLDQMFDGYSRVLYIDDGLADKEKCEAHSKEFAEYMHFRHESRCGTLSMLVSGIQRTKELARTFNKFSNV
jgi:hypothetical protein